MGNQAKLSDEEFSVSKMLTSTFVIENALCRGGVGWVATNKLTWLIT